MRFNLPCLVPHKVIFHLWSYPPRVLRSVTLPITSLKVELLVVPRVRIFAEPSIQSFNILA